jgi:acetolactate synthase I/II/III large subunit
VSLDVTAPTKESAMKVHTALARALVEDHGVSTVFGLLGGGNMLLVDDFVHRFHGTCVRTTREDGAVLGALGYGHATGALGVATVSPGPGFTNTVTALVEGVRNRTPLLVIAGDTHTLDPRNLHSIDQKAVTLSTEAGFVQVRDPTTALDDLATAVRRAFEERRPVVLNLPVEYAGADVEYTSPTPRPVEKAASTEDTASIDRALEVLGNAEKPILLAGWGAFEADATETLTTLAELIGAPVATTMKAKGLFRGSPVDLGTFGGMSSDIATEVIREADCIVAFGASLNTWTAAHGAHLDGKAIIQVDHLPDNIGILFPVTVGVVGDVRAVAQSMIEKLRAADAPAKDFRPRALEERLAAYNPFDEFEDTSAPDVVDIRTFMARLNQHLPPDRNVVTDGGRFVIAPMRYLDVREPRSWLAPLGFGSMGTAIGSALGVAMAKPDAPTVVVSGDGSLMMSPNEFNTAVRYSLDLIVVVLNDSAYGSEYHLFLHSDSADPQLATTLTTFDWPDLADIARSLGGDGLTVRSLDDLDAAVKAIESRDRPLLLDVKVDPAAKVGFMD